MKVYQIDYDLRKQRNYDQLGCISPVNCRLNDQLQKGGL